MMDQNHINWAFDNLKNHGYQASATNIEIIQSTPWSEVSRIKTDQGFVFLKKVPPALSLEANVINVLHKEFDANVPYIIADSPEYHCFLMNDAGMPLHNFFKQNFEDDILIQVIHEYTKLQLLAIDKIDIFLDLGVPDWRLEMLPKLYQDLIIQESLLLDDGLSKGELIKLNELAPKLFFICEKLSQFDIKDTFGHADFHDKNILINTATGKTTLIDLGEVVITHPFFSLHNCLYRAKENFSLSNDHFKKILKECLKPWLEKETPEHLFEILRLIQQCWSIHSVLGEFRLMQSVDQLAFKKLRRQGRLANNLRYWLRNTIK